MSNPLCSNDKCRNQISDTSYETLGSDALCDKCEKWRHIEHQRLMIQIQGKPSPCNNCDCHKILGFSS